MLTRRGVFLITFLMTAVVVAAAEGGVEIDEVDPLGAVARPDSAASTGSP